MVDEQVSPPGIAVTRYAEIALPPLEDGAIHPTITEEFSGVAVTPTGAPGVFIGITAAVDDDASPVPATFVAVTLNVYDVPLVNPKTVQLSNSGVETK